MNGTTGRWATFMKAMDGEAHQRLILTKSLGYTQLASLLRWHRAAFRYPCLESPPIASGKGQQWWVRSAAKLSAYNLGMLAP